MENEDDIIEEELDDDEDDLDGDEGEAPEETPESDEPTEEPDPEEEKRRIGPLEALEQKTKHLQDKLEVREKLIELFFQNRGKKEALLLALNELERGNIFDVLDDGQIVAIDGSGNTQSAEKVVTEFLNDNSFLAEPEPEPFDFDSALQADGKTKEGRLQIANQLFKEEPVETFEEQESASDFLERQASDELKSKDARLKFASGLE